MSFFKSLKYFFVPFFSSQTFFHITHFLILNQNPEYIFTYTLSFPYSVFVRLISFFFSLLKNWSTFSFHLAGWNVLFSIDTTCGFLLPSLSKYLFNLRAPYVKPHMGKITYETPIQWHESIEYYLNSEPKIVDFRSKGIQDERNMRKNLFITTDSLAKTPFQRTIEIDNYS